MKTLKQIADELGVSKDKIKYRTRKLPGNYMVKVDKITHVTIEGEKALRDVFSGKNADEKSGKMPEKNENYPYYPKNNTHMTKLISMLENELETKNRQIEALQNSLAAAQALHAMDAKRLDEKPQGGIFSRMFKKN